MAFSNLKKSEKKYHSDVAEYLPYACHFDEETILTKNGELMQVIKITGFNFETIREDGDSNSSPLRQIIRESIKKNLNGEEYAIWLHTLRNKRDISTGGLYAEGFCKQMHEAWAIRNDLKSQFVNELYISVIISGESLSIVNPKLFFETLFINSEFRRRKKALNQAAKKLDEVTNKIVADLASYGAEKLSIIKKRGVYYSQIMSFCSKIMNLKQENIPLKPVDLSKDLPSRSVIFQYNTIQVHGKRGANYGAVLSVKEYQEVSTKEIDRFLQLPIQFIISESFDFVSRKEIETAFSDQANIYKLSGAKSLPEASGFNELINAENKGVADYGQHQIIITVLENTVRAMQNAVSMAVDALRELGVVFIREDLFMEDCYWSQMPANFDFIRRQTYLVTNKIGGYASLYNFPAGKMTDNLWGSAVTVFHTEKNTPYFFNFHYEKNGHTTIIGPYGAGKTVLMNFLVSEAQKYRPKTYYFEVDKGSEIFINAIGGKYYHTFDEIADGRLKLNPLQLDDTVENRAFIEQWIEYLIELDELEENAHITNILSEEDRQKISEAIKLNYLLPKELRKLSVIIPQVWTNKESETARNLSEWYGEGTYAACFDNDIDNCQLRSEKIMAMDLSRIIDSRAVTMPLMSYLLHLVEMSLDGETPAIIVLDEAWKLIDNSAFLPRIESWLQRLTEKNSICIFATESFEQAKKSSITNTLIQNIKTQIFLPNPQADEGYMKIFGLNNAEYSKISSLNKNSRQFLFKHNTDSVICKLNLLGLNKELSVLSSTAVNVQAMNDAKNETTQDPKDWLPLFFEKIGV
ncbi:MAG TPA: hypothetical protein DIV86_07170 [Alphaproteobacteria bacterium]|nr:hypothetical protein [Alphaproteobacteria bacterium]